MERHFATNEEFVGSSPAGGIILRVAMYHYYVAFNYGGKEFHGSASGTVCWKQPLSTYSRILEVAEKIREQNTRYSTVVVMNIIYLEDGHLDCETCSSTPS